MIEDINAIPTPGLAAGLTCFSLSEAEIHFSVEIFVKSTSARPSQTKMAASVD